MMISNFYLENENLSMNVMANYIYNDKRRHKNTFSKLKNKAMTAILKSLLKHSGKL